MGDCLALDSDVQFVRGVGPLRAKQLARLGVTTVGDLIEYLPFRHELVPRSQPIGTLELGAVATVVGELQRVRSKGPPGREVVSADLVDGTGQCSARWFNSSYLLDKLRSARIVRLTGRVDAPGSRARLTNPALSVIEDDDDPLARDYDVYEPVYPATSELPSRHIARIIAGVLDVAAEAVEDFLPDSLRTLRRLPPRCTAIQRVHRPTAPNDALNARRRLAYDELLLFQLGVQLARRAQVAAVAARPIVTTEEIDRRIRRRFPYTLTPGQSRAVDEIRADLARSTPMNRLLHADVGAGKTAVAVYAALAAIANHQQVALIAPTEVLAEQHAAKINRYLAGSRVRLAYLAGSTPRGRRATLLSAICAGEIDLLIGTHAVLEPDVRFRDLGLAIIDEQHKFGVAQRAALRRKGSSPHVLVLTATPIPRTLAMTLFGDLDVSIIDGSLPGRRPVITRLVPPGETRRAWTFVRSRLERGEQVYVVYPLVEESDSLPLKAATAEAERLGRTTFAGFRVDLLHGRMKPTEKTEVMNRFRRGGTRVLVATTVIEVGVDVPDATIMAVQHADRYGLSQLHQLRGRIGRGSKQSFCLLFAESGGEASLARLKVMCETSDGFRIAEEDLRLRGPGELMGTRQHGVPAFRVADLTTDLDLLQLARDDAVGLLHADPRLTDPRHQSLRRELLRRYGAAFKLIDVA